MQGDSLACLEKGVKNEEKCAVVLLKKNKLCISYEEYSDILYKANLFFSAYLPPCRRRSNTLK